MPNQLMEQLRQLDTTTLLEQELATYCQRLIELGLFENELAIKLFILDFLPKAVQTHGATLPIGYEEESKR